MVFASLPVRTATACGSTAAPAMKIRDLTKHRENRSGRKHYAFHLIYSD